MNKNAYSTIDLHARRNAQMGKNMIAIQTHTLELVGTSYEIGCQLGKMTGEIPQLQAMHTNGMEGFGGEQLKEATAMFDRWCPGLTDELTGFADTLKVPLEKIFYYGMTYLLPRCSQIAVLPSASADGKPLLARNYEFSHETEDFCLVRTSVKGKYTHMGTSAVHFGREDGFNEFGLVVTQSSCGFPVGPLPYMRAPKLKGLQFWAVIRTLLENCKDVQEALNYLEGMPIAYNINLMLQDKEGNAALVETLDGRYEVKKLDGQTPEQVMWATNHAVLPVLAAVEPQALVHSVERYNYIKKQLMGAQNITREQLKGMLLSKYPDGLCCHFYEDFFGTTKSMVISPVDGTIELCWGGRVENGWITYDIKEPLDGSGQTIHLTKDKADPVIYQYFG